MVNENCEKCGTYEHVYEDHYCKECYIKMLEKENEELKAVILYLKRVPSQDDFNYKSEYEKQKKEYEELKQKFDDLNIGKNKELLEYDIYHLRRFIKDEIGYNDDEITELLLDKNYKYPELSNYSDEFIIENLLYDLENINLIFDMKCYIRYVENEIKTRRFKIPVFKDVNNEYKKVKNNEENN